MLTEGFDDVLQANLPDVGLAYSSLPQLVHAHAKHLLTAQNSRHPGIELWPHQLIASRQVSLVTLVLVYL